MDDATVQQIVIFVLVIVFALPLHEFGHALAADLCGDDVPALQGRVTMEPWAHWDPIGTLLIAVGIFGNGIAPIGWGKPVQTDPSHYRNGRLGWLLVASAGILVNILLALIGAGLYHLFHTDPFFTQLLQTFVLINLSLAVFNLLPIPPLDGSKILLWALPAPLAVRYEQAIQGVGILLIICVAVFAKGVIWVPVSWLMHHLGVPA
ncbi:MAG: site-2 protease family protein [Armatimonadota bacterium]|nr:site-2 protease family protein [Armatimonadota bacterium]